MTLEPQQQRGRGSGRLVQVSWVVGCTGCTLAAPYRVLPVLCAECELPAVTAMPVAPVVPDVRALPVPSVLPAVLTLRLVAQMSKPALPPASAALSAVHTVPDMPIVPCSAAARVVLAVQVLVYLVVLHGAIALDPCLFFYTQVCSSR